MDDSRARRRPRVSLALLTLAFALMLSGSIASATSNANVDFRGAWHVDSSCCDFTITSENLASGACTATSAGGFSIQGCQVSGSQYRFVVVQDGTTYRSNNAGTITGDKLSGHFSDSAGHETDYTATRKPTGSLTVSLTASGSAALGVGDTVRVTAKVTAGSSALTSVTLGSGLTTTSPAAVVSAKPGGTAGFSLAANASKSFTFTVKAVKAGSATFTLDATAKTLSGGAVSGSDSVSFQVGAKALAIALATSPRKFKLDVDSDGKVAPKNVTVKVTITNATKATIKGVQLLSLDPEPADKTQALDQLAFAKGTFPVKLGTFAPGASASRTYTLTVTGDGEYQLRALALYDDPSAPGGNGRATALGGGFEATVPFLYYSAKVDTDNLSATTGGQLVKGGAPWYISSTIKNESSYQRLCVLPLVPKLTGNAAATGPVDITAPGTLRSIGAPFAGALEPGKKVSLSMYVDTSAEGASNSKVSLSPTVGLLGNDGKCTSDTADGLTKLGAANKTIGKDSTDFAIHVDVSSPLAPRSSGGNNAINFFGGFGQNLFTDTFQQLLDVVALARSASSTQDEYKQLNTILPPGTVAVARSTYAAAQAIYAAGGVYANYWRTASDADKQSVITQAASVLSRVSGDFFVNAQQVVSETAAPWMTKMQNAVGHGDDAAVWHLWGQAWGSAAQQAVMFVFMDRLGAQLTKSAPALEQAAAAEGQTWKAAEQAAEQAVPATSVLPPATVLETVPAGALLTAAEEAPLWGIDAAADAAIGQIAEDEGVVIGVRGRSPGSIERLENGSVFKHEQIKPKNVSDIDVDWLGFRKADLSQVRFRTYTPAQEAAIRSNIAKSGLSEADQTAILSRFQTRLDEQQYVSKIEGFSKKGQINVGFNYRDNGINRPSSSVLRKFDLESSKIAEADGIPAGGTYYTPYQENPAAAKAFKNGAKLPDDCVQRLLSVLCTVTGDVDGVYITTVDGGPVPQAKLLEIYKKLQAAGWQHPETLTWINNQGEFFFGSKKKILAGLEQGGGEAMVEFGPDGKRRATYLDLAESTLLTRDDFYVRVVGGYSEAVKAGG